MLPSAPSLQVAALESHEALCSQHAPISAISACELFQPIIEVMCCICRSLSDSLHRTRRPWPAIVTEVHDHIMGEVEEKHAAVPFTADEVILGIDSQH